MVAFARVPSLRFAVLGHVEHIQMAEVSALPGPGEILHLDETRRFAGGGGAMAFRQLTRAVAEVHFFTAVGSDEAGREVKAGLSLLPGQLHAVVREHPHARALVLVPPSGDRTILVIGRPLHPEARDALPYDLLARCDGVYFTAEDPALLKLARAARIPGGHRASQGRTRASGHRAGRHRGQRLGPAGEKLASRLFPGARCGGDDRRRARRHD